VNAFAISDFPEMPAVFPNPARQIAHGGWEPVVSGRISKATAVILAGGFGTRLRTAVNDRPKALADVAGRPFMAYLLDQLRAFGVTHAVLCTGYMGELIEQRFAGGDRGLRVTCSRESTPLGTGGALRSVLSFMDSDSVLVMNGDSFCQADLSEMWNWHHEQTRTGTLLVARAADTSRYGCVRLDDHHRILGFDEKTSGGVPGWISGGVYILSRQAVSELPARTRLSLERDVFPAWIDRGLYGWPGAVRFIDIGTPESYTDAQTFFLENRDP
jgi:D-glycero-alpha-D-manno-heptose 1-phosphate guanylyltransferase